MQHVQLHHFRNIEQWIHGCMRQYALFLKGLGHQGIFSFVKVLLSTKPVLVLTFWVILPIVFSAFKACWFSVLRRHHQKYYNCILNWRLKIKRSGIWPLAESGMFKAWRQHTVREDIHQYKTAIKSCSPISLSWNLGLEYCDNLGSIS